MTGLSNESLWRRIRDYQFDKDGADLTFTKRLARENGWSIDFARRVTDEYKRFIYLVCTTDGVLTPSQEVDDVWHLHLIYTRDYWERFCRETLERDLHHTPTEGGPSEADKFRAAYRRCHTRYGEEFGDHPPTDIWPDETVRFGGVVAHVMIDPATTLVFSKKKVNTILRLSASAALAAGGIAAFSLADTGLGIFLMFVSISLLISTLTQGTRFEASISTDSGCGGCGGCGG